jgi:hypothetical protein
VAFDDNGALLVALRIQNKGVTALKDVKVSEIELSALPAQVPTTLPENIGDMGPDAIATIQANFDGRNLASTKTYRLEVEGSYLSRGEECGGDEEHSEDAHGDGEKVQAAGNDNRNGGGDEEHHRCRFKLHLPVKLPIPASVPLPTNSISVDPVKIGGAPFPPYAPATGDRNEVLLPPVPHTISDVFPSPSGSASQVSNPTLSQTGNGPRISARDDPANDPVVFITNTSLGTNRVNGTPPDMGGCSAGRLAFVTYNTSAAISSDSGSQFTIIDPTTVFPSSPTPGVDGGFCCDQHAIYVPQIDRVIWLMQFGPIANQQSSKVRIASASPADILASGGTAWTYWDLTSSTFNLTGWMDYPSLSYGNTFLYMAINALGSPGGRLVVRIPLQQLHDSATINMNYLFSNGCYPTQNAGGTVYWSSHNSNKQMRVYEWAENSGSVFQHDVNIQPWPTDNNGSKTDPYVSIAPNGQDWTESEWTFPGCTRGATQALGPARHEGQLFANEIWFAWTATPGGGFPNVHLQVVRIDPVDFSLIAQDQIWNSDYAFAYGSLTTNSANQVGVAAAWGGGTFNENSAVGIYGDHVLYITGSSDDSQGRWGDYITVREHSPDQALFSAETYSTNKASEGGFEPHYILYGRQSALNPPPPPR